MGAGFAYSTYMMRAYNPKVCGLPKGLRSLFQRKRPVMSAFARHEGNAWMDAMYKTRRNISSEKYYVGCFHEKKMVRFMWVDLVDCKRN